MAITFWAFGSIFGTCSGNGEAGAGVNHISKRLGETGTPFYLPSYTLVRALASYEPSEAVKISLDVTNLFDKRYYDAIYRSGSPFSYVAPGRSATLSVSFTM